jgi:DNA-binding response OmpR family regulator
MFERGSLMSAPSLAPHSGASAMPPTVLVVEDDAAVRQACAIMLEDHGFHVVTAVDGVDGLRKFRQINPDVVLTDIIMPEKEGVGLIMELRRETPEVKIVVMSGGGRMGNMDFIKIATMLGANIGLYKPFDDLQLVDAIRALLKRAPVTPAQAA